MKIVDKVLNLITTLVLVSQLIYKLFEIISEEKSSLNYLGQIT